MKHKDCTLTHFSVSLYASFMFPFEILIRTINAGSPIDLVKPMQNYLMYNSMHVERCTKNTFGKKVPNIAI
jgi:hypothetical protein